MPSPQYTTFEDIHNDGVRYGLVCDLVVSDQLEFHDRLLQLNLITLGLA
jgi:hypothetical protein